MESLIKLEELLLEENPEGVKGYLSEIDRKTANEMMVKVGEAFGFPTMEVHGVVYTHMGMLAKIFGYADISGLSKLVDAYQLSSVSIGWYGVEVNTRLREMFNLSPKDSKATFVTWDTFLIAGMYGQNPEAQKVKLYLLKAERAVRVGGSTMDRLKYENYRLRKIERTIALASKIGHMADSPFKNAAIEAFEELTGKTFTRQKQLQLPFTREVK